jgi:hypothetical protein
MKKLKEVEEIEDWMNWERLLCDWTSDTSPSPDAI